MVETLKLQMYIVLHKNDIIIILKYKNSLFYKGALLWDTLTVNVKQCLTLIEFKKALNNLYRHYDDIMICLWEL